MKHCIFLLLFAFTLMGARAKTPRHGFMVEHGGASHTLGLAFDSRIGTYKNWGYKVGLARITTSSTDDFFSDEGRTNGWAVPAQMYYLVGGKRHSLELGIGLTVGLFESFYHKEYDGQGCVYSSDMESTVTEPIKTNQYGPRTPFGWCMNVTAAYRYQMERGLFLRLGVTDNFNLTDGNHFITRDYTLAPFASFGIAF